jgi:hypothetical protein
VSPTRWAALQAQILLARAEVDQLAGAPERAEASLRAALRIYQDRHATPLADQAAAALARLTGPPAPSRPERPGDKRPEWVICTRPCAPLTRLPTAPSRRSGSARPSGSNLRCVISPRVLVAIHRALWLRRSGASDPGRRK